jgi:hypothetical protein
MSAISSKSRLVFFLLVVIALVFFITSFVTATFTNGVNTGDSQQTGSPPSCTMVRNGEGREFGECNSS